MELPTFCVINILTWIIILNDMCGEEDVFNDCCRKPLIKEAESYVYVTTCAFSLSGCPRKDKVSSEGKLFKGSLANVHELLKESKGSVKV